MVDIREIKENELDQCIGVINQSFATVAQTFHLTKENCTKHPSFMLVDVLEQRFADGYEMYGLFEDEKLVGYVSISVDDENVTELHNVSVLPDYRHQGYGKRLLEFCEAWAKERNISKIKLDIIEENVVLKNWYLQNGYTHLYVKSYPYLPFTVGFMAKDI